MKENKSLMEIPLSKIRENPNNPRSVIDSVDDLKASIRNSGLLQPIAVRRKDGVDEDIREFLEMDSREEFERRANDKLGEDWEPEENKEEN